MLRSKCKCCKTLDGCKNSIFCKNYTHCIKHTPLCNTKVFIVAHVVYIIHRVQDYTLCCIAYTAWYYTEGVKLLHRKVLFFAVILEKFTPNGKNLHEHHSWYL